MKLHLSVPRLSSKVIAEVIKMLAIGGMVVIVFMLFKIVSQNNELAKQAKETAEQNQRIAKANGAHIDCISHVFADYTRDKRPITINDLDKCKITTEDLNNLMSGAVDFTPTPSNSSSPAPTRQIETPQKTDTSQNPTPETKTAPPQTSTPPPTQSTPPAPDTPPLIVVPVPDLPMIPGCISLQSVKCR